MCLLPEATPSASVINATAYLPSLGSGVPFLLLYPAAPAAGTQRTRTGLFLSWLSSAAAPPHTDPPTQQPSRKPPKSPKPSISPVSTAYYTSAKTSGGQEGCNQQLNHLFDEQLGSINALIGSYLHYLTEDYASKDSHS